MKRILALLISFAFLLSCACSQRGESPAAESSASTLPAQSAEPSPTGEPVQITPETPAQEVGETPFEPEFVSAKEAWGNVESIVFYMGDIGAPLEITASGDMLCKWRDEFYLYDENAHAELRIFNIYSHEETLIQEFEAPWSVYPNACINDDWVIYTVHSVNNPSIYQIYIYDRNTGISTLFYAPTVEGTVPYPALNGNKMLLAKYDGYDEDGALRVTCYEYDLTTGEQTLAIENATRPVYGDDGSIYVMGPDPEGWEQGLSRIYKYVDGELIPLMTEGKSIYMAPMYAGGEDFLFIATNPNRAYWIGSLYLLEDGELTMLFEGGGNITGPNYDNATASSRMFQWRYGQGGYAYDRLLDKWIKLTDISGSCLNTEDFFGWAYEMDTEDELSSNYYYNCEFVLYRVEDLPVPTP